MRNTFWDHQLTCYRDDWGRRSLQWKQMTTMEGKISMNISRITYTSKVQISVHCSRPKWSAYTSKSQIHTICTICDSAHPVTYNPEFCGFFPPLHLPFFTYRRSLCRLGVLYTPESQKALRIYGDHCNRQIPIWGALNTYLVQELE